MAVTQVPGKQIGPLDLTAEVTGTLPAANGGTGQTSLTAVPLTDPVVTGSLFGPNGRSLAIGATASAVNYFYMEARASGSPPVFQVQGTDANIPFVFVPQGVSGMNVYTPGAADVLLFSDGAATDVGWNIATKNAGTVKANGVPVLTTTNTVAVSGKTETLAAGSTSVAPLKFTAGTNLTTAAAGAAEFDGTVFYLTPAASTRHVNDAEQFITLTSTYTLANQTAAQKLFNSSTNGTVTLVANSTYFFECCFTLSSLSASAHSFGFALGGTATLTRQAWWADAVGAAPGTATASLRTFNTAAQTTLITAGNTSQTASAEIKGKLVVGTGGTLIPQVSQLTNAAAAVVGNDSYFRIWSVGANTVTNVGNWS